MGWAYLRGIMVPAVDEHGGVMVPVQEDELLLAEEDEVSVDELGELEKQNRKDQRPRCPWTRTSRHTELSQP